MPAEPRKGGWLQKKGAGLSGWKKRWCRLDGDELKYFEDEAESKLKGSFNLHQSTCRKSGDKEFSITGPHLSRTVQLRVEQAADRAVWLTAISAVDSAGGLSPAEAAQHVQAAGDIRVCVFGSKSNDYYHFTELWPASEKPPSESRKSDIIGGLMWWFLAYASPQPGTTRWDILKAKHGIGNWVRPEGGQGPPGDSTPTCQGTFYAPRVDPSQGPCPEGTVYMRFRFAKVGKFVTWRDPEPATAVGFEPYVDSAWKIMFALQPAGGGGGGACPLKQPVRHDDPVAFRGTAEESQAATVIQARFRDKRERDMHVARKQGESVAQLLEECQRHHPGVTAELVRKKAACGLARRYAMEDVVDTMGERMQRRFHSNWVLNAAEARIKARTFDKTADSIGALEADVKWSTWKSVGEKVEIDGQKVKLDFGSTMRKAHFHLPAEGGFTDGVCGGVTPKAVIEAREQWNQCNQVNPVMWRFKSQPLRLMQAESRLAHLICADPNDTHLVADGRYGVSAVVRGLPWRPGDRVLTLSCAGDAIRNAAEWLRVHRAVEPVVVDVALPADDKDITESVAKALKLMARKSEVMPTLAMFDHVTPREGCVLPVRELRRACVKHTCSTLVDGSLAVGQCDVNIGQIGADWYVGHAHSWLFTCPGVGFIVADAHKHLVTEPLTVSYFDEQGYEKEFEYYGLQDFSTWCSVLQALEFAKKVCGGWPEIRKYGTKLAKECCQVFRDAWGVGPLQGDGNCGMMPVIPLPELPAGVSADNDTAARLSMLLLDRGLTVKVVCSSVGGAPRLCARFTCTVYNDRTEYERIAKAVLEVLPRLGDSAAAPLSEAERVLLPLPLL
eukprot:TRINITY_DN22344_c0_g1_i1.p1 TRINITY_DN22344_c0_g1~~TRINITY_DN22344_c0_g1_i1.p1  ORF type:complete len:862 (+),score=257.40 TRINITY_DN22344_c0_g1_i1:66-2588(+)